MAAKNGALKREKKCGKVTRKLPNGMYATSKDYVVPPYPGIEIGDEVEIDAEGKFVLPKKEQPKIAADAVVSRAEFEALKKQNEQLAKLLGEKGSAVKAPGAGKDA